MAPTIPSDTACQEVEERLLQLYALPAVVLQALSYYTQQPPNVDHLAFDPREHRGLHEVKGCPQLTRQSVAAVHRLGHPEGAQR